jgi:hypothetical protein
LDEAYAKFERRATMGDWLFLSERLARSPDDERNLSHSAVERLGLSKGEVQFSEDPQYMMLEMVYTVNRQVKTSLEKGEVDAGQVPMLGGKLQALIMTIQQYEMFNTSLSEDKRVNYRKSAPAYVDPLKADEKIMRDLADPIEAMPAFCSLYESDPERCMDVLQGFVKYADYLHSVAARKKVEGQTLKPRVKSMVSPIAVKYKQRAQQLKDVPAQEKMIKEITSILNGKAYLYMAEIQSP